MRLPSLPMTRTRWETSSRWKTSSRNLTFRQVNVRAARQAFAGGLPSKRMESRVRILDLQPVPSCKHRARLQAQEGIAVRKLKCLSLWWISPSSWWRWSWSNRCQHAGNHHTCSAPRPRHENRAQLITGRKSVAQIQLPHLDGAVQSCCASVRNVAKSLYRGKSCLLQVCSRREWRRRIDNSMFRHCLHFLDAHCARICQWTW